MLKSVSFANPASSIKSNSTTGILQITGPAAGTTRVMTVPDANFTVARIDAAQSFTGDQTLATGNLIIGTSGKGIDFSATPNPGGMTSELFSDYEEGTWTPVLSDGTNNATMDAQAAGSYTRIGNRVFINAYIITSSLGSVSGNLRVTGLPFTTADSNDGIGAGVAGYGVNFNLASGESVSFRTIKNTTYMILEVWGGTGGSAAMTSTKWTNTGGIMVNFSYRV